MTKGEKDEARFTTISGSFGAPALYRRRFAPGLVVGCSW